MDRYARQILLPQIGQAGQDKLAGACVLLVGVGALGCTIADLLARAGVGKIVLVDRDIVERTNLQRQTLYDEADAAQSRPKAYAAAMRLVAINRRVEVVHVVTDVTPDNIRDLLYVYLPTVIIDGTDNVETRFLINDASINSGIPWIYGAAVAMEGRVMPVVPAVTPCLRCIFPTPPAPGELPTCDTAGVLAPASVIIGSLQATEAIRMIVEGRTAVRAEMVTMDLWSRRFRTIDLSDARRIDCPACVQHRFDYLNSTAALTASLCGRNTVQVRMANVPRQSLAAPAQPLLDQVESRLAGVLTEIHRSEYLIRGRIDESTEMSVFADGRVLVHGLSDPTRARAIVARYLG